MQQPSGNGGNVMSTDQASLNRVTASVEIIGYPAIRWAMLATVCFAIISFQVTAMSFSPLLGEIGRDMGIGLAQSVDFMSYFMLFSAISFFPAGPFGDRFGPAASITVSAILSAVPALLTIWIGHSYLAVVMTRIAEGFAVGFAMTAMPPLVLQWFPPQERGLALGIPGACMPLATFVGVMAAPLLFEATGDWRVAVAVLSVFGWFALAFCLVMFRLGKKYKPKSLVTQSQGDGSEAFRRALVSPVTWIGVLVTFLVNWTLHDAFSLSPSYFAEPQPVGLGLGPMTAGQLMGVIQIASMVGPIVGGLLVDKVFGGNPLKVLPLAFLLTFVYAALQSDVVYGTRPIFLIVLVIIGMGIGMLFPLIQTRIAEMYDPRIVGKMNGIWLGIGAFGGSAGLFVNSLALKATGTYQLSINIIAAAPLIALVLCFFLKAAPRTDK
jgi:MFS family permease